MMNSCFESNFSTLIALKETFVNLSDLVISSTTLIFLLMLSTSKNLHSGNNIANGIPGKPPPVPTSSIEVFFLN